MATPDSRYQVRQAKSGEYRGKYVLSRVWPSGRSLMVGLYDDRARAEHAARTLNSQQEK